MNSWQDGFQVGCEVKRTMTVKSNEADLSHSLCDQLKIYLQVRIFIIIIIAIVIMMMMIGFVTSSLAVGQFRAENTPMDT